MILATPSRASRSAAQRNGAALGIGEIAGCHLEQPIGKVPQSTGCRHLVADRRQIRIGRASACLTTNVERRRHITVQDGVRRS